MVLRAEISALVNYPVVILKLGGFSSANEIRNSCIIFFKRDKRGDLIHRRLHGFENEPSTFIFDNHQYYAIIRLYIYILLIDQAQLKTILSKRELHGFIRIPCQYVNIYYIPQCQMINEDMSWHGFGMKDMSSS